MDIISFTKSALWMKFSNLYTLNILNIDLPARKHLLRTIPLHRWQRFMSIWLFQCCYLEFHSVLNPRHNYSLHRKITYTQDSIQTILVTVVWVFVVELVTYGNQLGTYSLDLIKTKCNCHQYSTRIRQIKRMYNEILNVKDKN